MSHISSEAIHNLVTTLDSELQALHHLAADIATVQREMQQNRAHPWRSYETMALKLHNFYAGCERIFSAVVAELNGGLPQEVDWPRRLLDKMGTARDYRPALLATETAHELHDFLTFCHTMRNIHGFQLNIARVDYLVACYPAAWQHVQADVTQFMAWLTTLATSTTGE